MSSEWVHFLSFSPYLIPSQSLVVQIVTKEKNSHLVAIVRGSFPSNEGSNPNFPQFPKQRDGKTLSVHGLCSMISSFRTYRKRRR